jgi:Helix-hairpin-helix domain
MDRKRSPANKDTQPQRNDDLKLINGIGPAVEQHLYSNGVNTFSKLAGHSPADIAELLALRGLSGMTADRIKRENWIGQARKLAEESTVSESQQVVEATIDTGQAAGLTAPVEEPAPDILEQALSATPLEESQQGTAPSPTGYHPAMFTVELLLDESNNVQSTHVKHIQSKSEQAWTGWQKTQLLDFLSESAELNSLSDEPVLPNAEEPVHPGKPDYAPTVVAESETLTPPEANSRLTGHLHLREMEIVGVASSSPRKTLARNKPFAVHLTLDLSELQVPRNTPLNYIASIYAKSRRSGLVLGQIQGTIIPTDTVTLKVEENTLSEEGIYQLVAQVIVGLPTMQLRIRPGTTAVIDGGQVQVN